MDELNEDKMVMQQEINELKLKLNQIKQENANMQLELHQKDEVYLKLQSEEQNKENLHKIELKKLNEKLEALNEQCGNGEMKEIRDENKKLKTVESELKEKMNKLMEEINGSKKVMKEYDETLATKAAEYKKLEEEYEIVKQHLSALEMAFSDIHTKYERAKGVINGYKNNEDTLVDSLAKSNEVATKYEERYESLKAHAKAQLDKANREIAVIKQGHQAELNKFTTLIKRLEIKCASIQQTLDQKTKECFALSALCDELTESTTKAS